MCIVLDKMVAKRLFVLFCFVFWLSCLLSRSGCYVERNWSWMQVLAGTLRNIINTETSQLGISTCCSFCSRSVWLLFLLSVCLAALFAVCLPDILAQFTKCQSIEGYMSLYSMWHHDRCIGEALSRCLDGLLYNIKTRAFFSCLIMLWGSKSYFIYTCVHLGLWSFWPTVVDAKKI